MFRPLFWLFKVTGLCPSGSRFDSYLSATSFTAASIFSILAYRHFISMLLDSLQSIAILFTSPIMYLSFLVPIAQAHCRKQRFLSICERLAPPEGSSGSSYYSELFQFSMFLVIMLTTLLEYFHVQVAGNTFFNWTVLHFFIVVSLQHAALVCRLDDKFCDLNDRLRAVAARPQTAALSRLRADLRQLLREHALLRRLVKQINSYFAVHTLCSFFTSFVFLSTEMYTFLLVIRGRPDVSQAFMIFAIIQTGFLLVYRIDVCHRCSDKANEAVMIVHRMVNPDSPADLMDDVELFSLAQFKNPVVLTAAGVFNLNRGLITKAGAASLSYLIVAVQLKSVA